MQRQESSNTTRSLLGNWLSFIRRFLTVIISCLSALTIIACFSSLIIMFIIRHRHAASSILPYPNVVCSQRSCGCPNSDNETSFIPRIVGGQQATPYIYPWLVSLTDRGRLDPFCAGFIISSNIILTAAHCLNNRTPNRIEILSKIHDLKAFKGHRHTIDQWIIHPEYQMNDSMHLNDIALIKVKQAFTDDLQPCCLPRKRSSVYPRPRTKAIISGWGRTKSKPNSGNSPILQHAVIPIVEYSNKRCYNSIADRSRQICAGYDTFPIDTCTGDSGAPLLVVETDGDEQYFVAAGIVSYGNKKCDASVSSGIYTRVSFYLEWIQRTIAYL